MYFEIKTERLLLRPVDLSDLENIHEYASDEENTKYMLHLPNETIEETASFLSGAVSEWEKDTPDFYEFAIEADGVHIGHISVYLDEKHESGELGWILNKKYWNKGYASEAAAALKEYVFNNLNLNKLIAHCDHRNKASARVMEKIGLKLESDSGIRVYPKRNETAYELEYTFTIQS